MVWVHYGAAAVQVDAFTSKWTTRAAEVVWRTPKGETHRAWVWLNAVRRRLLNNTERLAGFTALR